MVPNDDASGHRDDALKLLDLSRSFLFDTIGTTLCLQYPAATLKCAAIHLASKFGKIPLLDASTANNSQGAWWQQEKGVKYDHIIDACHQILTAYELPKGE